MNYRSTYNFSSSRNIVCRPSDSPLTTRMYDCSFTVDTHQAMWMIFMIYVGSTLGVIAILHPKFGQALYAVLYELTHVVTIAITCALIFTMFSPQHVTAVAVAV